jgi:hypothetical protein
MVWEIERILVEGDTRPILFYYEVATCRRPYLKT